MTPEVEMLQRRVERERAARKEAEFILEQKALELFFANNELRTLNEGLEIEVSDRTSALLAEQVRLRSLIANLDSGVLFEDENRKIVLANNFFCKLFGISETPEDFEGTDCDQCLEMFKTFFADPAYFESRTKELIERRELCSEEELYFADGRVFSRSFIPVYANDKYLGNLWKYRDVTKSHLAAEALKHSEEKYRGIIENMELGLLEVDNQGLIVRAYPRFCEMVDYEEEDLIGKDAATTFVVPEFLPTLQKQGADRAKGIAGVYEIQIFTKNKETIWVLISGAPIFDHEDKIIGSLGIHYDITKQKNLQRDLEEARRKAEEAQEAEKQFLANMSHEIRTPLTAIIGMSHLMYDTQPTPEQREYLDVLRNSAEMLRALISDVLDLSKILAGHFDVQENEYDIAGLTRSMVKSLELRIAERPVKALIKVDPKFKNLIIGDDLLFHQILNNLLGNAEKFTEKGKIEVSIQVAKEKALDGRPQIELRVMDTGIGIPSEKIEMIFQSFRQVDGDIKRKYGGTGLGLAITRKIVELQGGTIRVETELHKGSTFVVTIPYKDSGKAVSASNKPEQVFRLLSSTEKRILVVEDNYMNRKYIGALLRKWGLNHTFAHNGREGVETANLETFDLILMDIQMPEMDGYEASIAIRQTTNPNTQTPIIALTASALISQKDKAFLAGMNDYLSKPFKPRQLFDKITHYCGSPDEHLDQDAALPGLGNARLFEFHPRLDAEMLKELYGDDLDYACDMFSTFLKNVFPEFDRIRPMLVAGQYTDLARISHKLKPTFGMVGLPDIEEEMQKLEQAAKKIKPSRKQIESLFYSIEAKLPAALLAVESDFGKLKTFNSEIKTV